MSIPKNPCPKTRRTLSLTVLTVLAALAFAASGCARPPERAGTGISGKPGSAENAPRIQKIPVRTQPAERGAIENTITITGRVAAKHEVTVVSKIQGRVASVKVDIGDTVRQGQMLITLESQDIASQVQQAEAAYQTAQSNHDRMKMLFEEGAVSQQQWEQARLQLTQAEVALALARSQLSNSIITAPINGVVTSRRIDPGEVASPGQPLITLMDTSKLYLEGNLTENQAAKVKPAQAVTIKVDAFPDRAFKGLVASIGPAGDAQQRTFPIKILITDDEPSLKPGMFGTALIPIERREGVVTVPVDAVLKHNMGDVVFIHKDGVARIRKVQLGLSDGLRVEVASGLREGEAVIVSGQQYLQDGTPVAVRSTSAGSGSPAAGDSTPSGAGGAGAGTGAGGAGARTGGGGSGTGSGAGGGR